MRWDLFCHVVDNFGDVGVCWRLAADLAEHGEGVRLWIDDPSALAWMAPGGHVGVEVLPWRHAQGPASVHPADVVVEAFGCNPPQTFVAGMARTSKPPVWINLEYLSAEDYVERSHGLPSPLSSGPGAGLVKWFYYPGFTPATGGLLRERGLIRRLEALDAPAWLAAHGAMPAHGERVVSLFCYENPRLSDLLDELAHAPTLLLVAAGTPAAQVRAALGDGLARGSLRAHLLPFMPQPEYDELLAVSDLNFVRGEDSFVRAQWAAKPFVWQIYPQFDGAHAAKLNAFLDRFVEAAPPALVTELRCTWDAWNGAPASSCPLPHLAAWRIHARRWRDRLLAQRPLTEQLIGFARERR